MTKGAEGTEMMGVIGERAVVTGATGAIAKAMLAMALGCAAIAAAGEDGGPDAARAAAIAAWSQGGTEAALRVDAAAGTVTALAEFCGIDPAATVEFPVVGELSDRGYEAVFRTCARPGAIAAGIESLGVPRGQNVSHGAFEFWPRGERVAIDVAPLESGDSAWKPLQNYIIDLETRAPLAIDSFTYCGSRDDPDVPGGRLCDTIAPNSVVSTYNDAHTVLDIPKRSDQSAAYGRYVLDPNHGLDARALYRIRFRRSRSPHPATTLDIGVTAREGAIGFMVSADGGAAAFEDPAALVRRVRAAAGSDITARISFDPALTVAEAATGARLLAKIEGDDGIRPAGPAPGQVYYKGFLPDDAWRDRKARPSQPWELRFSRDAGGGLAAALVRTIEDWSAQDSLEPALSTRDFHPATPAAAAATVASMGESLPVLLVFAPSDARLAEIMPFVSALAKDHPTAYVFAE